MKKSPVSCAVAFMLAATSLGASAEGLAPPAWFASLGLATHATRSVTLGGVWPLGWQSSFLGTQVNAQVEGYVSAWSFRSLGGGRDTLAQVGVVPILRMRFDQGRSDWFADAGIGLSWTNDLYTAADKQFSTRFNFHDTVGIGYSFGANRSQEVGLRFLHYSNAGIKHPNPGIEFLQLRYARQF